MTKLAREEMIANALDTKEGRKLLWKKGFLPGVKWFAKNIFSKWDTERQIRWMNVAFGSNWELKYKEIK